MPVSRIKRHTKKYRSKATVEVKVKKKRKASQKLEELPSAAVILTVEMSMVMRLLVI